MHARLTSVLSSPSQEPPEIFSQAVVTVHPLLQVNHLGGLAAEIPLALDGPGQLQGLERAKKESNRVRKHNNKQYLYLTKRILTHKDYRNITIFKR